MLSVLPRVAHTRDLVIISHRVISMLRPGSMLLAAAVPALGLDARGRARSTGATKELETASNEGIMQIRSFELAFFREATSVACNGKGRVVVLDIGCNSGEWAEAIMTRLHRKPCLRAASRLFMFEPQQSFHERLQKIARAHNGMLLPYAAWTSNTTLNMTIPSERGYSESARIPLDRSASPSKCVSFAKHVRCNLVRMPAIDLADFMLRTLIPTDLVLAKLDVEGAEYTILPAVIAHGALCRLSYLQLEWHLNNNAEHERLSGVSLKHTLRLLSRACRRPLRILDEEFRPLNFGRPVPGLIDEAMRHVGDGRIHGNLGTLAVNYSILVRKGRSKMANGRTLINGVR